MAVNPGCFNWEKVAGTNDVSLFAFGKGANDQDFPSLYIYGKVQNDFGLWRSTDQGESWEKIGRHPLGLASKIVTIEGDKNEFGKIWVGFPGNGLAYGIDKVASGVKERHIKKPSTCGLLKNYPNPFNPETQIEFQVRKRSHARLSVLDINGQVVAILLDGVCEPGIRKTQFHAQNYASGIYLCCLQIDDKK